MTTATISSIPDSKPAPASRLTSLDQFRGYTMLGMLLVNFCGGFVVCPRVMKHTNDYCSYADTIMPHFLFAAGFAMRLSLVRRLETDGKMPWGRAVRRILGLALVAIAWYTFCDVRSISRNLQTLPLGTTLLMLFKRDYFQTLLHIAATSLWILPVVTCSWKVRLPYLAFSAILHVALSWWFNFVWVNTPPNGIDGGPLGFLAWSVPALCGTLAYDAVKTSGPAAAVRIGLYGLLTMLVGWGFSLGTVLYNVHEDSSAPALTAVDVQSTLNNPNLNKLAPDPVIPAMERLRTYDGSIVEPPFVPPPDAKYRQWNYWMMCQRCASLSYVTFAGGLSLVLYALFLWACDRKNIRLGLFRTLGTNSLAAYLLHDTWGWIIEPVFPKKSLAFDDWVTGIATVVARGLPLSFELTVYLLKLGHMLLGFACLTLLVYATCRLLERFGLYIRV